MDFVILWRQKSALSGLESKSRVAEIKGLKIAKKLLALDHVTRAVGISRFHCFLYQHIQSV